MCLITIFGIVFVNFLLNLLSFSGITTFSGTLSTQEHISCFAPAAVGAPDATASVSTPLLLSMYDVPKHLFPQRKLQLMSTSASPQVVAGS